MTPASIFEPMLVMLLLTIVVWLWLFARRTAYMMANNIDAEQVKTPEQVQQLIPDHVSAPAHNFKNLFEVPVLFYVVCLMAVALNQVDGLLINCAWAFVILRALHSIVHCTYNRVMHRFLSYMVSCLVLWFMVGKLAWAVFF